VTEEDIIKLEVNIFDFDENIYGKDIKINLIDYLRDEEKFDTLEDLKKQMLTDKENSLEIINSLTNNK